jgi:RNA polymerase sigma-70 factor (ECF subfamily)
MPGAADRGIQQPGLRLRQPVLQVAEGDRQAFESVYQLASGRLFAICLHTLRDRRDAEEVLQDVFTTVWRKATQFDATRASAMTWLSMMARNRAIDRLRSAPPRPLDDLSVAEEIPDFAPQPAQAAEHASDRERLDDCLDTLEPRRRSLIRMGHAEYIADEPEPHAPAVVEVPAFTPTTTTKKK